MGLTGTPVAPPLGELSPKVTERARMLPENHNRSDSIALTKSLPPDEFSLIMYNFFEM